MPAGKVPALILVNISVASRPDALWPATFCAAVEPCPPVPALIGWNEKRRQIMTTRIATRTATVFAALLALAACETVEGAGQDIENAGQAIEGEARETQSQI